MIRYVLKDQNINPNQFVSESHKMFFIARPFDASMPLTEQGADQERLFETSHGSVSGEKSSGDQESVFAGKRSEIGIQTDSRDEYCQTDPYTPSETRKGKENLEILSLRHFKWGSHLPPTIDELVFIEEQREKRAFEASLPPLSDEFSFNLRRRIMEHQEIHEWHKRENEIKKSQSKKLSLLQNLLVEREKQIEENNFFRVEAVKNSMNAQKNALVAKVQAQRIKVIRKLTRLERQFESLGAQPSIIDRYQNFGSEVYANIMRNGFSLERFSDRFKTDLKSLTNFEMYSELVNSLDAGHFTVTISVDEMMAKTERKFLKLEKHNLQQLKKAQENFAMKAINRNNPNLGDIYDLNIQNVVPRPDTPYYEERIELLNYPHQEVNLDRNNIKPQEEKIALEDCKNKVASMLQRLLRGRAIQNIMFEGKEKRLALIDELLIVANTTAKNPFEEEKLAQAVQREEEAAARQNDFHGQVISRTLEVLNKELLKKIEADKLKVFVKEATVERQRRETEETGRRQAQLILKRREEKLYQDLIDTNKEAVEGLLEDVFVFSTDFLAETEAKKLTELKERKFVKYVEQNNDNYEVLIKDFLHLFLVPNIDRQKLQAKVMDTQRDGVGKMG
jgi:hypothetical protein